MKKLLLIVFLLCGAYLIAGCGGSGDNKDASEADKKLSIGVIPKGTTHEFWKAIHAGAIKASRELDVDIIWKGPLKEDDREEQVQVVETFISSQVDAIVLAPLDDRALIMPVREALAQNIPTIIIDSDLQEDFHVSFVATDNYKGGTLAGERMGELLGGTGKLVVLRYQEGSASTMAREAGFLDTVKSKYPGIEILSDNQYAGATTETAQNVVENLLNRFDGLDAFFSPNESSTFGSLRAIQDAGLAGKIVFIGFDSSAKLIEAMENGEIQGLVLQNPFKMGYMGVKTAYEHLKGGQVEKHIDTGVEIATPENMNDPEIQQLLKPDISQYLD
jgi:ribose transport system substrate-binding protein